MSFCSVLTELTESSSFYSKGRLFTLPLSSRAGDCLRSLLGEGDLTGESERAAPPSFPCPFNGENKLASVREELGSFEDAIDERRMSLARRVLSCGSRLLNAWLVCVCGE